MMVRILILLIKGYQKIISPLIPGRCRFNPTCSQYCIDALQKYGLYKGLWKGSKRILNVILGILVEMILHDKVTGGETCKFWFVGEKVGTLIQFVGSSLEWLYQLTEQIGIPSYALAIIILTIILKIILYPLTHKQMKSMKVMQEIQPKYGIG